MYYLRTTLQIAFEVTASIDLSCVTVVSAAARRLNEVIVMNGTVDGVNVDFDYCDYVYITSAVFHVATYNEAVITTVVI